ncbi:hypothetical protein GOODEAATRI_006929 [Goodea atripinnis]|uniref:Par3/HAL N-terminal domain-containing protein n=1 Tax=Goodea atripinnis TaxID=208336 RepID=A0ABV0PC39_9TELE
MPRFTVHIRDEWLAVACRDTSNTIQWLGQEALKRYIKNKPDNGGIGSVKETRFIVRRCQGSGLLDPDDTIDDVLEDNDFVELGLGNPLSPERTRMLLALRINVLAKGYSGISLETLQAMIQAFNGKLQHDPSASGLALINGTQMITSLGAEAVERAQAIAQQADIVAALTLEVLKGTTKAFDSGEQQQEQM